MYSEYAEQVLMARAGARANIELEVKEKVIETEARVTAGDNLSRRFGEDSYKKQSR